MCNTPLFHRFYFNVNRNVTLLCAIDTSTKIFLNINAQNGLPIGSNWIQIEFSFKKLNYLFRYKWFWAVPSRVQISVQNFHSIFRMIFSFIQKMGRNFRLHIVSKWKTQQIPCFSSQKILCQIVSKKRLKRPFL